MPSMLHEGPLDLVREHPEIAVELVRGCPGIQLPGQPAVSLAPTDMSAVVPRPGCVAAVSRPLPS